MTELQFVDLTERQAEIADWYLGSPAAEHWFEPGQDFSHLPEPKLENRRFAFPDDKEWFDDFKYRVTVQLPQMATGTTQIDTIQAVKGLKRAAQNLVEKVENEVSFEDDY